MFRPDLHKALKADVNGIIMDHYIRAVGLRFDFTGVSLPWLKSGEVQMPNCHVVAHAYAKAFEVEVVDGEHAYVESVDTTRLLNRTRIEISTYVHSWNIIRVDDSVSMILDIFPDEGCPIMPVLLLNPHPAYWVPSDNEFRANVIDKLASDEKFPIEVNLVAKEFSKLETRSPGET